MSVLTSEKPLLVAHVSLTLPVVLQHSAFQEGLLRKFKPSSITIHDRRRAKLLVDSKRRGMRKLFSADANKKTSRFLCVLLLRLGYLGRNKSAFRVRLRDSRPKERANGTCEQRAQVTG